ncbi:MAG: Co2+/Mg2+ efflux protein ApaG [Pseudomonadota bacterium]
MNAPDLKVSARPLYLSDQSDPDAERYVFSYQIEVANQSDMRVQLMSRYWLITHGSGRVEEVVGEGVVGQQPVIEAGSAFRYSSGAILESPVGTMEGHYVLVDDAGLEFQLPIPRFRLSMPGILH